MAYIRFVLFSIIFITFRLSTHDARVNRKTPKSFTKLNNWHDYYFESLHISGGLRTFGRIWVLLPKTAGCIQIIVFINIYVPNNYSTSPNHEFRPVNAAALLIEVKSYTRTNKTQCDSIVNYFQWILFEERFSGLTRNDHTSQLKVTAQWNSWEEKQAKKDITYGSVILFSKFEAQPEFTSNDL